MVNSILSHVLLLRGKHDLNVLVKWSRDMLDMLRQYIKSYYPTFLDLTLIEHHKFPWLYVDYSHKCCDMNL